MSSSSSDPPSAPAPLVEVSGLGVWYRMHRRRGATLKRSLLELRLPEQREMLWALRDVSFTCHEGEALGVVGRNGAGKSTLCLALAGILAADEGEVTVHGRVSPLLSLGAGFQRDLSGRANIELYAAFLGISRSVLAARMGEIIEFSGLGEFLDEPVRGYSDGMRARLGFAVVTALDPEILVVDEILGVGDREFRARSRERMREMIRRSRLIVVVSHSSALLRELCSRVLWLDAGRVRALGPTAEVLDAYAAELGGEDPHEDES